MPMPASWDCSLEAGPGGRPALRLGLRLVRGFVGRAGARLVSARRDGVFISVQDLAERAGLSAQDLGALAAGGALAAIAGNRYRAGWQVAGVEAPLPLLPRMRMAEGVPMLRGPTEGEDIAADYHSLGLTLGRHPLALLRCRLRRDAGPAARPVSRSLLPAAGFTRPDW